MNSLLPKYLATLIGFAFVAVWVTAGGGAAFLCMLGSAAFYCGTVVIQQQRRNLFAKRFMERSLVESTRDGRSGSRQTRRTQEPQRPSRSIPSAKQNATLFDVAEDEAWEPAALAEQGW